MASGAQLTNSMIATRVGTLIITADSATAGGTNISLGTVTCFLEIGKKYALRATAQISGSVAGNGGLLIIAEDSSSGTQLTARQVGTPTTSTFGWGVDAYAEYTATVTGNKTFALAMRLFVGSGNVQLRAGASFPAYLTVDLIPT